MDNEKKEQLPTQEPKMTELVKSTNPIPDWEHDRETIPRLQVVDEHQAFR